MSALALHAAGPRLSFWWPARHLPWQPTRAAALRAAHSLPPGPRPQVTEPSAPAHARERQFEEVALRWLPDVARFARSLTRDEQAADDLVQETYLRAWRHWDTFRTGGEARAWLFTIARNTWHRMGSRAARYVPVEDEVLEAFAGDDAPMAAPAQVAQTLARADIGPAIMTAVAALPEPFRLVVELVDLQEVPYAEAAQILDIPIGTVRSRLFRARRLLQEALVEHARDLGLVPPAADAENRP